MNHKLTTVPMARAIADKRFRFKLSDGSLDRDGDVIDAEGWNVDEYVKNPVVLWAHDLKMPRPAFSPPRPLGSVPYGPPPPAITYHEQQLLEWSVVNVPSNPAASLQVLSPKARYDLAIRKNFLRIEDGRARLTPHTQGLDEVRLKSFLTRSDQAPSQYCPKGLMCPSKAGQLQPSQCPAKDCPLTMPRGKEPRFEIDLTDLNNRTAIRDAMVTELTRQARALSQGLVAEIVRPALREHRLRATGRVD
jgi:hypothetical protein